MAKLTAGGKLDQVYVPDDRDAVVSKLLDKDRLPKYGGNSLKPPKRAFNEAEAAAADRIGMPPEEQE